MSNEQELLSLAQAFFAEEAPFEYLRDIPSQAAEDIPDEFIQWMEKLKDDERAVVVRILLEDVLSDEATLGSHPGNVEKVLLAVIRRWPTLLSEAMISTITREATRSDLLESWKFENAARAKDFYERKKDYRYALVLWHLLNDNGRDEGHQLRQFYLKRMPESPLHKALEMAKNFADERDQENKTDESPGKG